MSSEAAAPGPDAAAPNVASAPEPAPGSTIPEAAMPTFPIPTPDSIKAAEQQAVATHKKLNAQSASVRQYLESSVVGILMQGMQALCKERPDDPVEYLALYLLKHNPNKPQGGAAGVSKEPKA